MVRLDKAHTHNLQVASSCAAPDKGIGLAEVVPLHSLIVIHLLLLLAQRLSLLG